MDMPILIERFRRALKSLRFLSTVFNTFSMERFLSLNFLLVVSLPSAVEQKKPNLKPPNSTYITPLFNLSFKVGVRVQAHSSKVTEYT